MKSGTFVILAGIIAMVLTSGCGESGGQYHSLIVAELSVEGSPLPADGQSMAEVRVRVFQVSEMGRHPLEGIEMEVISSRNQGADKVDFFEQPVGPTFAEGEAVAYVGSSEPGEAVMYAEYNGSILCATWDEGVCVQAAEAVVTFSP